MELTLRKARKLEAKIQNYVDNMSPSPSVRVRVLANEAERQKALQEGREKYINDLKTQEMLICARFTIRAMIGDANQAVGINTLINQREATQAFLAKSNSGVDTIDELEASDLAASKKLHLEKGGNGYSEASVSFPLPVATKEDVSQFKSIESRLKKDLENIEDELSQKNLGAKINLDEGITNLLQSVGLL